MVLATMSLIEYALVILQVREPSGVDVTAGLVGPAIGSFLTTLLVGAVLVAVAPDYVERMLDAVGDDPLGSFVAGLLAVGALVVVSILLALTVVGILLVIPLAFVAWLTWAVGAVIAFLAIAERLVGLDEGWLKPLVVAAVLNGGLTLTGVGGLVSFCVGAVGFGAVLRDWLA